MQAVASKEERFWDKAAEGYAKRPVADEESYQKKLSMTRKYMRPDMEVFEFGCGTGSTAILHAPHVRSILATDVAENMLAIGRERAAEAGVTNVTFERAGIEDLDPSGRQFDMVLGLNIIHLCKDPEAVMQKVHALLKPGGYFVQSTVCLKDFKAFFKHLIPFLQLIGKAPYVNRTLTSAELHEMIARTGFEIVEEWCPGGAKADFIIAQKA